MLAPTKTMYCSAEPCVDSICSYAVLFGVAALSGNLTQKVSNDYLLYLASITSKSDMLPPLVVILGSKALHAVTREAEM